MTWASRTLGRRRASLIGIRIVVACLLLAATATACGSRTTSPPAQTARPPSIGPTAVAPSPDPILVDAQRFRVRYGLRADEAWVRGVAADPEAQQGVLDFGVPLLPFERLDLESRRTDLDLLKQINDYGSLFPGSYAGAYMDQRASQAFVASFKDDVARHRSALANLLPAGARVEVVDVDWSTAELDRFVMGVEAEKGWFKTIGVQYLTADRGITDDFVSVDYLGPVEAASTIEHHFGDPTWLVAERQGPLPWAGARGNLVIAVVDQAGRPVPGLRCEFVSNDLAAVEGGEDIFGTDDNGRCVIPNLPAVPYRITLHRFVDDDHYEPIKSFDIVLAPGGSTVSVAITP